MERVVILCEWALSDTTTSLISGNDVPGFLEACGRDSRIFNLFAITAHAGHVAIEQSLFRWLYGSASPVPVWLVTGVSTLLAQCLLVGPDVQAVCWKQVRLYDCM